MANGVRRGGLRAGLCMPCVLWLSACLAGDGGQPRLIVAATHTLEDSGLLDTLVAAFRAAHPEHDLQVVLAGSGEVLALGGRGDADVLLTHSPAAEEAFVRDGLGRDRRPVMHNDFVLLGPAADPAGAGTAATAAEAFGRIRAAAAPFVSRGDDGGTHVKERQLWAALEVVPDWPGYVEAGLGMADALRLADRRGAYILADRATWANLRAQLDLRLLFQGDPLLLNQYSAMLVRQPSNPPAAYAFLEWLTGPAARALIAGFGRDRFGQQVFLPDSLAR